MTTELCPCPQSNHLTRVTTANVLWFMPNYRPDSPTIITVKPCNLTAVKVGDLHAKSFGAFYFKPHSSNTLVMQIKVSIFTPRNFVKNEIKGAGSKNVLQYFTMMGCKVLWSVCLSSQIPHNTSMKQLNAKSASATKPPVKQLVSARTLITLPRGLSATFWCYIIIYGTDGRLLLTANFKVRWHKNWAKNHKSGPDKL